MPTIFDRARAKERRWVLAATLASIALGLVWGLEYLGHLAANTESLLAFELLAIFCPMSWVHTKAGSRLLGCIISSLLGGILACSLVLIGTHYMQLGLFAGSLALYHVSEYVCVMLFHYDALTVDNFLIYQSWQYVVAVSFAIAEYLFQLWIMQEYKCVLSLVFLGLVGMGIGHVFRIGAMVTAGANFTHVIQLVRGRQHRLVTTGFYALTRHPGYFGWYLWAVSSQVMMVNPLSILVFWNAGYCFFNVRINYEEETLIMLFGQEYVQYMLRVPTRIPGVPGVNPRLYDKLH